MSPKLFLIGFPVLIAGLAGAAVWSLRPTDQTPVGPAAKDLESYNIDPVEFGKVHHYVTAQMELETKAQSSKLAPAFDRTDDFGKKVHVGVGDRPQLVLFVKRGCPCSIDAQPLFTKLAIKFEGKVDFVGVIDKDAKGFSNQFRASFPIVDEPSKALMKAYDARSSVYSALVARNGHIVKMWPGYSAAWLKEMNGLLAKASATKETPFNTEYAPVEKASGCPFF